MSLILAVLFILVALAVTLDFGRFKGARKAEGHKVDAGGVLFVQGGRTYYDMPNGVRRKIADYPMDLTPNSADMNMFTQTMDQAKRQHEAKKTKDRKEALTNMRKVADDAAIQA